MFTLVKSISNELTKEALAIGGSMNLLFQDEVVCEGYFSGKKIEGFSGYKTKENTVITRGNAGTRGWSSILSGRHENGFKPNPIFLFIA